MHLTSNYVDGCNVEEVIDKRPPINLIHNENEYVFSDFKAAIAGVDKPDKSAHSCVFTVNKRQVPS